MASASGVGGGGHKRTICYFWLLFVQILRHHGIQLDEEDLYHLMSDIDTNMDGKLSYAEFLKYFLV